MQKFKKLRAEFCRILHIFTAYVAVKANTPLGQLLIESVFIVFAVYMLNEIAEWISTLLL
jgi:hypothetical protein